MKNTLIFSGLSLVVLTCGLKYQKVRIAKNLNKRLTELRWEFMELQIAKCESDIEHIEYLIQEKLSPQPQIDLLAESLGFDSKFLKA